MDTNYMQFTCLSKGRGYYVPPCHILDISGFQILLECPLDLEALSVFAPTPNHNSTTAGGVSDQCPDSHGSSLDTTNLIYAVPWYKTISSLHLWNAAFINVVLISSPMAMLGLPFLTRSKDFSAKIYATEATVRLGKLMTDDLVSMHREYRQFYGPEELEGPLWMKWEELEKMPPMLRQILLGQEGTELGAWLPIYTAADVKDCFQKVKLLRYAEEVCYNGALIIKAVSSGLDIGASNWVIKTPELHLAYLCNLVVGSAHSMDFDFSSLQAPDILIYSDFSSLYGSDSEDRAECGNFQSDEIENIYQDATIESLLYTDEISEESEKINYISSCAFDALKAGGSVLIPTGRIGVILQIMEHMSLSQELSALNAPIYMISTMAEELLSFTNVIPEWLSKQKQEKLFSGEPLFSHLNLLKEKKLLIFPDIWSPNLPTLWQEPCIVFCPHWSLRLGPAVHFLQRWAHDQNSLLVLEKEVDANLALLPFKPLNIRILQCSFLSGIRQPKIIPLVEKLRPKLALFPEDSKKLIRIPNASSYALLHYSINEMLQLPRLNNSSEIEIATDLVSQFSWRNLQYHNMSISRLKGELSVSRGKYQLAFGNKLGRDSSGVHSLVHWGSPDLGELLATLGKMGISVSIDQTKKDGSDTSIVHVTEPGEAFIEVKSTTIVIRAGTENLAFLIFKAVESTLDGI